MSFERKIIDKLGDHKAEEVNLFNNNNYIDRRINP